MVKIICAVLLCHPASAYVKVLGQLAGTLARQQLSGIYLEHSWYAVRYADSFYCTYKFCCVWMK